MKRVALFASACVLSLSLLTACGGGAEAPATQEAPAAIEAPADNTTETAAETPAEASGTADGLVTYSADEATSTVQWYGSKVGGKHEGEIGLNFAEFRFDGTDLASGVIEFDMNDIVCTDLEGEDAADLEGHLKNEDFFDSANHPKATFILDWTKNRGNFVDGGVVWQVKGELEVKGVSDRLGATATIPQ